ncbi:polysaccharide biosynthesis/export protein [mine drainage metagenome]|uniref:Polysaccharide biosynthesis/export protein n=1 Tax=mine drainage metagenome TaxID=410659 RepID=A0A1J5RWA9_9ZZZZ
MSKVFFIVFSSLFIYSNFELVYAADKPDVYHLHQGDKILISVWREETLQKEVIVLPDGSVTFPLIGRVEVAGLSTPEVEQSITKKLKTYLPEPIVTVLIVGIDGNRAYVMGKVVHPGSLIISGPTTVLQAISIAGGFEKFADESSIKVIRVKPEGQEILPVDYKDIISGKNISTNIQLKAGDTLVVP